MNFIKNYTFKTKYVAMMIIESLNEDGLIPEFVFTTEASYSTMHKTFDSQEEAIDFAYEENNSAEWIVLPKIIFNK